MCLLTGKCYPVRYTQAALPDSKEYIMVVNPQYIGNGNGQDSDSDSDVNDCEVDEEVDKSDECGQYA